MTHKRGHKTRRTRRRGGVWPFAKKTEYLPPPSPPSKEFSVVSPMFKKEANAYIDDERKKGNQAAFVAQERVQDLLKIGGKSRRRTRRRGGAECDDRWDEEKDECLKGVAAREAKEREARQLTPEEKAAFKAQREVLLAKKGGRRSTKKSTRRRR